jgi:hypothetical protein
VKYGPRNILVHLHHEQITQAYLRSVVYDVLDFDKGQTSFTNMNKATYFIIL